MSYSYIKTPLLTKKAPKNKNPIQSPPKKIAAFGLLLTGFLLFASAAVPILRFQFFETAFKQVISPVSTSFYNKNRQVLGDTTTDYTKLSNWFQTNQDSSGALDRPEGKSYSLTIPKLKIENSKVIIGSNDLQKSLIQYAETSLPGQLGTTVIFGHSVLPQFFNPKSYTTIFSTLYKLKQGDEIYIDYDGVRYKYIVEEMYEVDPTDLSVVEQRFDGKYLNVITCHPPGTYLKRLVVRSRIADY